MLHQSPASASWEVQKIQDTSGNFGTANVEKYAGTVSNPMPLRQITAGSVVNGESANWTAENCPETGTRCVYIAMSLETGNDGVLKPLVLPGFRFVRLKLLYFDGTPIKNQEVSIDNDINSTFCLPPQGLTGRCVWMAGLTSSALGRVANTTRNAVFSDSEGYVTVISLQTAIPSKARAQLSVIYGSRGVGDTIDLAAIQNNDVLKFNLNPSNVEAAEKEAKLLANKCTPLPSGKPVIQIPACSAFAPLPSGQSILVANDPLTYREQTPNSVIALQGLIEKEITSVEVLTDNFCHSPKILTGFKWVDKSKVYLSITTGSEGMCRLKVTTNLGMVYEVQMPVSSWAVSVMRPPTILGNGLSNQGILKVGNSIQLSNLSFNYSGSTFNVGQVTPLYFSIKNENVCSVDENFLVLAKSSGQCVITIGWPEFAFGSRVYSSGSSEFALFTVKSNAELAQDAEKLKYERQLSAEKAKQAAEKAKQDAKLCKPSDQSRLRNAYAPVTATINITEVLRSKFDRVNYLISQVGKNSSIQLPPSEYSDLLAGYPVLANSRQVPIYVYQAILQGALIGENKNYQSALARANLAYSKASAGCKKVIGKP